jgi:hypothetical protein
MNRRAPRLGPDERIAGYVTRRGRFRRIDPARGRPLPGTARVLGAAAWALLLTESFRRARRAVRASRDGEMADALEA